MDNGAHDDGCGYHHAYERHGDSKNLSVEVCIHDQATVGSASFVSGESSEELREDMTHVLEDIASWVTESGGIIGHIKCSLQNEGETTMLSLTDDEVSCRRVESRTCKVNIACIVFGTDEEDLGRKLSDMLNR